MAKVAEIKKVARSVVKVKSSAGNQLRMTTLTKMVSPQIIIVINGGYVVCDTAKLVTKEQGTHELTLTIPIDEMTVYEKELFE
jgi:hypothetical protein